MKALIQRWIVSCAVLLLGLGSPGGAGAQAPQGSQGFLKDYTKGPSWFPAFYRPSQQQQIPVATLENSPRLRDLIHDGKLELSLADALALALENNLDIAVQRYLQPMADVDILRAKSGQAARGVSGANIPGGLSAGAIGAGVTAGAAGGGGGGAGGITGGGGAVSVGQVGAFDPAVSFGFSWDRVTSPLNSVVVSGIPTVTSYATSYSGNYTQLFPTGTSYTLALSGLRQSTTQQSTLYNPSVTTSFGLSFNQPLLSGFGKLPNTRFMMVAKNDRRIADETFRLQVVTTVVLLENSYWDMAGFQESVKVAEQSLAAATKLLEDNKKQAEIGTLAPLDVVSAESEVAARQRDLIVAQTNLQVQETKLKNMLSRRPDPALDAAQIQITDQMPEPRDADLPDPQDALANALRNRPELRQDEGNLQNQSISVQFTNNSLLPGTSVFGLYNGAGLQGASSTGVGGAGDSLHQTFAGDFPEYAGGLSLSLPLRNRSAQADNVRAQLENNQLEVGLQRTRNQVALEIKQAVIGLLQGKAQVEAAHEATRLAQQTLDAEQKKLQAGVSTPYQVILRERDLVTAQQSEVTAVASYSKALVEMDRAMGTTLDRNGIQFADAQNGAVTKMPTPPFSVRGFTTGTQGGR